MNRNSREWTLTLLSGLLLLGGCFTDGHDVPLASGVQLTYELDLESVDAEGPELIASTRDTLLNRLELYGLKKFSILAEGPNRLVVRIPGAMGSVDVQTVKRLLDGVGKLEFALVAGDEFQTPDRIQEFEKEGRKFETARVEWILKKRAQAAGQRSNRNAPPDFLEPVPEEPQRVVRPQVEAKSLPNGSWEMVTISNKWGNPLTVIENRGGSIVSGMYLNRAVEVFDDAGRPAVGFGLNPAGAKAMAALSGSNMGRELAIVLDGRIRQVAVIKERIYDSAQLTGNFSQQEVRGIVSIVRGGSLPVKPNLISEGAIRAATGR